MPVCFVESFPGGGFCGEECILIAKELSGRGAWVITKVPRGAPLPAAPTRADLVVGSPDFVRAGLKQLAVPAPAPPDYPACLRPFLHREVFPSTLGQVSATFAAAPATRLFVKPAQDAKAFNGELLAGADEAGMWLGMWTAAHGPAYPVLCSEPLDMLVEHRAFCLGGAVKGVGRYGRSAPEGCPPLDMDVVHAAASTLASSAEALAGCAMDWAVARRADGTHCTALVEVNDGVFTGYYEGVSPSDFTDMVLARWAQLVGAPAAAASE